MLKRLGFCLVVVSGCLGHARESNAGHIDVTYTVSGSPGDYFLDFSVTNNMLAWPTQNIYSFAVQLSVDNITGSPAPFSNAAPMDLNPFGSGGSNTNYNNVWIGFAAPYTQFLPGTTLSGFIVNISDPVAPAAVSWNAISVSPGRADLYTGLENYDPPGIQGQENPGFEGIAVAVPEPSSLVLSGILVGFLGALWTHKRLIQPRVAVRDHGKN